MKRLAFLVVLVACGCAPPPPKAETAAPLPAMQSAPGGGATGGGGGGEGEMHLAVHEQVGDRDGDGVVDDLDKCPDDPEDRDGFQDEDGCPDPDNDGDGILDVRDQCPNDPGPPPSGCPKPKRP